MRNNLKYTLGLLFIVVVFTLVTNPVWAHHKAEVLGDATASSQLNFPPVTSGPGYLLPDSPLYFLDNLKQTIRVALISDSAKRAETHMDIAGERLAELRIMVARNNDAAINSALFGMVWEVNQAAKSLTEAQASGKDVKKLASGINDTIKTQRDLLTTLIDQSSGATQLEFKAARRSLQESKIEVEDNLPEEELWRDIDETLSTNVSENIAENADLAKKLQLDLDRLDAMASQAAQRAIEERTQALQKAMDSDNAAEIAAQKKMLADEKAKQDKLITAEKAYAVEARKVLGNSKLTIENLQNAQKIIDQIKK